MAAVWLLAPPSRLASCRRVGRATRNASCAFACG
ncbi:Mobile element protein [Caballeronia sordidicola]|uniref:Mobile element protein n=1 Tax=Caballeronia sordidicola TaxID=196367 RepID=A0A242M299_CABSO|nr:Mobile element protein [Caballeronia sordidicola]